MGDVQKMRFDKIRFLCMEMVSAKGIYYNNKNTEQLLAIDEREHPVSLQIFGPRAAGRG